MINPSRVTVLMSKCVCDDTVSDGVVVNGIVYNYRLNPEKLNKHKEEISGMLDQLSENFFHNIGGGWSFLQMSEDRDGNQWTGLHSTMEQLMCLGIGIGRVRYNLPREMWKALPGGMPYIVID